MIVKLDKERKIYLLKALQSNEIETAIVESWRGDAKQMSDEDIDNEIIKLESISGNNFSLCPQRVKNRLCPYKYLNLAAIDEGVKNVNRQ